MTTAMALQAITAALSAMMLAILWSLRRCGLPGIGVWWRANLVITLSLVLFALRGRIPDWITIVIANACLTWALVMFHAGTMQFCGLRPRWGVLALGTLAVMAGVVYWHYVDDSVNLRVTVVSTFHAAVLAWVAAVLIRHRPANGTRSHYLTTAAFAIVFSAGHVVRSALSLLVLLGHGDPASVPGFSIEFLMLGALVMPAMSMGAVLMLHDAMVRRLEAVANTDYLTGSLSRKAFEDGVRRAMAGARRHRKPLALLILDIDRFKRVNDNFGHAAGDAVLVAFARTARECVRPADLVGRMGGEEFLVLLPDADETVAFAVAERLRTAVEAVPVTGPFGAIRYTVSGGIAVWRQGETLEAVAARADTALYLAKMAGRNQMRVNHDEGPQTTTADERVGLAAN